MSNVDWSQFATKADFQLLTVEILKIQDKMKKMESQMATKDDIGRILSAIDAFTGQAIRYDRKAILHADQLEKHDAVLDDHSRRIESLEKRRGDGRQ